MPFFAHKFWLLAVLFAALGQFAPFASHFCPMQNAVAQSALVEGSPVSNVSCPQCTPPQLDWRCLPCCETNSGAVWTSTPLLASSRTQFEPHHNTVAATSAAPVQVAFSGDEKITWAATDLPPPHAGFAQTFSSRGPPRAI